MDSHTLVCDSRGFISNVTEGLNFELGLNSKLFTFSANEMSSSNISIENICPEVGDPDARELLEIEGMTVTIDTRELLNLVELEKFNSDELLDIRSKLGTFQAFLQLKYQEYGKGKCKLTFCRVIILPEDDQRVKARASFQGGLKRLLGSNGHQDTPRDPSQ